MVSGQGPEDERLARAQRALRAHSGPDSLDRQEFAIGRRTRVSTHDPYDPGDRDGRNTRETTASRTKLRGTTTKQDLIDLPTCAQVDTRSHARLAQWPLRTDGSSQS
jgi:hypothetical protein